MKSTKSGLLLAGLASALLGHAALAQEAGQPEFLSQTPDIADSELALADRPPPGLPMLPMPPGMGFFDNLGLSDEQLEKLANLRNQFELNTAQKKAEMKFKLRQMMDLLSQQNVDKAKVMALQNDINTVQADLSNSRASFMADSSSVFTADQRKQMRHMMLMRSVNKGCMGRGGPGGPGGPGGWGGGCHH